MVVKQSGNKTADHKIVSFESDMHRWWLMHPAGNRLKIVNRKNIRITAAIPSYYVKGMMCIMNAIEHPLFLNANQEITGFVQRLRKFRRSHIPLTVGRILQELLKPADVFFRISD